MKVDRRIDDKPDRSGIGRVVTKTAAASINRARRHARAATNAFQRRPELVHSQPVGAAIVNNHDMHLGAGARLAKMRRVLRHRNAQSLTRQQPDEHAEVLDTWHQLLDAHGNDVQRRRIGGQVRVSLIGADRYGAGLGDGEIATGKARVRVQNDRAGRLWLRIGKVMNVVVVGIRAQFAREHLGDITSGFVYRWAYDVAWRLVVELLDPLAEIGFSHLDAGGAHIFIKAAFVGEHRLGLDQSPRASGTKDVVDDPIVLGSA